MKRQEETNEEKMELYFNQWCFENTKTKNSYYDATSEPNH